MPRNRILETALCAGLFATLSGSPALAQDWQTDSSTLHVVEPLRVPGAVLEPGTYRIRVVDEQSDRNIVQVTDLDGHKVYATMIATPHVADRGRPDTEFVYYRDADGNPMALRSWWAPNDPYGQDLYYEGAEGAELARLAERIPAAPAGSRVAFAGNTSGPAAAPAVVPAVKSEKPAAVVAANEPAPKPKMPRTASPMPLVALAGLSALAGAAALRLTARRGAGPGFPEP